MTRFRLFIFDLDNTIYDWYSAFLPAFYAMVDRASDLLSCDRELLLTQLQSVHVRHGDVEHPFSLLETELVTARIEAEGEQRVVGLLDPAFHAFNSARKSNLRLFPGVTETLSRLRSLGHKIVAHTDSKYFGAIGRLQRLGILDFFDQVYCREKSITRAPLAYRRDEEELVTKVTQLPSHEIKPNPRVLLDIVAAQHELMSSTAYVGDSIAKDIMMAKRAGCFAIWAKYGAHTDAEMYARLIRISHWNKADIEREKHYREEALTVQPDFTCEHEISELLALAASRTGVAFAS